LLKKTIEIIFPENDDCDYRLDPERITLIDHGDYQGIYIFIIARDSCQPSQEDHWYTNVSYGSCSACDILQKINLYNDEEPPSEEQIEQCWTLCLHMVQKMKRMTEGDK
jgi:hypothetical protein